MGATYTKLRDGSWGIRSTEPVDAGDSITVTKKSGETKVERVRRVIWHGDGVWLASIETTRRSRYRRYRRSRWDEYEDPEDRWSHGYVFPRTA